MDKENIEEFSNVKTFSVFISIIDIMILIANLHQIN